MKTATELANYVCNVSSSQSTALTKAMGLHGQWGMSSAFDFLEIYDKLLQKKLKTAESASSPQVEELPNESSSTQRLNLLYMYPGDVRHIISSVARCRRYFKNNESFPELHFYVLEPNAELLTRELILLSIFFHLEMPIRYKANTFLEVYGNLKIQKRTKQLLAQLAKELVPVITQTFSMTSGSSTALILQQLLQFDLFTFRDHDTVHNALTNYYSPQFSFKLQDFFNTRQRSLCEDRYDSRQALYDWDYHQNYKKTASIIHIKLYKTWRETGIAFEFGDQVYSEANPTFASYTEGVMKKGDKRGEKQEVLGYFGDLVDAPYISFGVNSDSNQNLHAESLYEILNKNTGTEQHRHHAVEVSLYNLYSFLWELETGHSYQMMKAHDIYSGLGREYKKIEAFQVEDLLEEITSEKDDKAVSVEEGKAADQEKSTEEEVKDVKEAEKEKVTNQTKPTLEDPTQTDIKSIEQALEILSNLQEVLQHVHIHPIIASNTELLSKSKFRNLFHGIFVSNRYSAVLKEAEQFQQLFAPPSSAMEGWENILAVETLKFLVPVNQEVKQQYNKKIDEYTKAMSFQPFPEPPIHIRKRDEHDLEDDLLFYCRK